MNYDSLEQLKVAIIAAQISTVFLFFFQQIVGLPVANKIACASAGAAIGRRFA